MPTASDLASFQRLQQGQQFDATMKLVAELPPIPQEVKARFPSMAKHEEAMKEWHNKLLIALKGGVA